MLNACPVLALRRYASHSEGTCEWTIHETSVLDLSLRGRPRIQRTVRTSRYFWNSFGTDSKPCLALPLRSRCLELKRSVYQIGFQTPSPPGLRSGGRFGVSKAAGLRLEGAVHAHVWGLTARLAVPCKSHRTFQRRAPEIQAWECPR